MGRELRLVAADWQHPTTEQGNYIPLRGGSYSQWLATYREEEAQWANGFRRSFEEPSDWVPLSDDERGMTYVAWTDEPYLPGEFMPDWPPEQRTHFQYYETTTEGRPISPPLPSLRELVQWLVDHKVPFEGDEPGVYSQWYSYLIGQLPLKTTWGFSEELAPLGAFGSVKLLAESPRAQLAQRLQAIRVATKPWFVIIWEKLTANAATAPAASDEVPGPDRTQPYCCYVRTIIFYHKPYTLTADGKEYERYRECESVLRVDDVIEFEGERFEIGPGTVVWWEGAWYMRHWGRRLQSQ